MKFTKVKKIYEEDYKKLLLIPLLIILFSSGFLCYQKITTGEFVLKDISITGGAQIIIQVPIALDVSEVEHKMQSITGSVVNVRQLRGLGGGSEISYSIDMESGFSKDEIIDAIQQAIGLELTDSQYSVSETSPTLGSSFWSSAIKALIIAFISMAIMVFYYFRIPAPSLAVIASPVADIIGTIAILNLLGMKLSTSGVAALLMIIGYSVDTDILLSTKLLKVKTGSLMVRLYSAMKTGLTMQSVTLIALTIMWLLSPAQILKHIAIVLIIGLLLDMVSTWLQTAGILRWYLEKKEKKNE